VRQPPLRIALVSEHASPLAVLGGADAGGQNVHVAELARHLARKGAEVVVHTRRDDPSLPRRAPLAPGVVVDHVDAGPPVPLPKDELVGWMGDFADDLVRSWRARPPHVVHAHFWMSGLAARRAGRELGIPVALTYHALGAVKRRHQGEADTSPPGREAAEAELARAVDLVIATSHDELAELARAGATPRRAVVVPCGVDLRRFHPCHPGGARHHDGAGRGPSGPGGGSAGPQLVPPRRPGLARIVTVGRLV
jgi:D-inositol-3-phosphate glycosyltransferase